ncbi:transferrin receptor protein 1 [Gastrophryne carolinensis]
MERARAALTDLFGRVPLTYTRFSLTPQTDGDASQVEMKLADDEECGDATLEDHVVTQRQGSNGCKSLCFKILAVTLLFFIGFIIGYLTHRGRVSSTANSVNEAVAQTTNIVEESEDLAHMDDAPTNLYWSDLRPMMDRYVELIDFESSIIKLSDMSREAGSANEMSLAAMMHSEFTNMNLDKVWDDEHYVTLQEMGSSNKVQIRKAGEEVQSYNPTSYVAYSPAGSVTAGVVYCRYGLAEDFDLANKKVNVTGKLVLVRSGQISFAEKVRNAEMAQAVGVLIYPEPSDFTFPPDDDQQIESPFGHAHFGTGDPYTPGFPSFNHTQFPPSKSSGLPQIPVQSLSSTDGKHLFGLLERGGCPADGQEACMLPTEYEVKLDVNNILVERKILNVFGVVKGFEEPDRYVVVGSQRDSCGKGVANAVAGTSVLLELARVLTRMVKEDGYKPRRSIVFASWSAGDYGAVGATEWLEGYLSNLHLKTISYISLDAAVQGSGALQVSASPLMHTMIRKTLNEVSDPVANNDKTLSSQAQTKDFFQALFLGDPAYPFLAFSGVPSVSFRFIKDKRPYAYLGTKKDTLENFQKLVTINKMFKAVAKIAAQIVLRLTHDHKLPLDFVKYKEVLHKVAIDLGSDWQEIKSLNMTLQWINSASGDFGRAANSLKTVIDQSDLDNKPFLRTLNDRIMKVEHSMLSPYASPGLSPFRHIFCGYGSHTVAHLKKTLRMLKEDRLSVNKDDLKNQLALLTWTIQGAANSLGGEIWEINNEF